MICVTEARIEETHIVEEQEQVTVKQVRMVIEIPPTGNLWHNCKQNALECIWPTLSSCKKLFSYKRKPVHKSMSVKTDSAVPKFVKPNYCVFILFIVHQTYRQMLA